MYVDFCSGREVMNVTGFCKCSYFMKLLYENVVVMVEGRGSLRLGSDDKERCWR